MWESLSTVVHRQFSGSNQRERDERFVRNVAIQATRAMVRRIEISACTHLDESCLAGFVLRFMDVEQVACPPDFLSADFRPVYRTEEGSFLNFSWVWALDKRPEWLISVVEGSHLKLPACIHFRGERFYCPGVILHPAHVTAPEGRSSAVLRVLEGISLNPAPAPSIRNAFPVIVRCNSTSGSVMDVSGWVVSVRTGWARFWLRWDSSSWCPPSYSQQVS